MREPNGHGYYLSAESTTVAAGDNLKTAHDIHSYTLNVADEILSMLKNFGTF